MNISSGISPAGIDGNNFPRQSGSMTTSDVVTKMDREQTPPLR